MSHHDAVPDVLEDAPTSPHPRFPNRRAAGRTLAGELMEYRDRDAIVIGLAPGGVIVADEIARALELRLEAWIVRELPGGALAEGASLVLDSARIVWSTRMRTHTRTLVHDAAAEIRDRARRYRGLRARCDVRDKLAIVVDEGVTTARRLRAAIRALRKCGAAEIVVAAPVGSPDAVDEIASEQAHAVCLAIPERLPDLGAWYEEFHAVSDAEIMQALARKRKFVRTIGRWSVHCKS